MQKLSAIFFVLFLSAQGLQSSDQDNISELQRSINEAYSNLDYDNIGKICFIEKNNRLSSLGSVVYIGGNTCLTAAHIFKPPVDKANFFLQFVYRKRPIECSEVLICFEINKKKELYEIDEYVIHEKYSETKCFYDIAILKLRNTVKGITGLTPCYKYGDERLFLKNDYDVFPNSPNAHIPNQLTYVGHLNKMYHYKLRDDCIMSRIISRSYLIAVDNEMAYLTSAPYGVNFFEGTKEEGWYTKPRLSLSLETGFKSGISGGATLHETYGLIGINTHTSYKFSDKTVSYRRYVLTHFNIIIDFFNFLLSPFLYPSLPAFRVEDAIPGQISFSVALGSCKDWIEGNRNKFNSGNVGQLLSISNLHKTFDA